MTILVVTIHVIVCLSLILIVLLQTGKGADMGAAFGGGASQTLFGSTGATTFLSKATTVAAIVFMLTCFTLAYMSTHKTTKSIMKDSGIPISVPADQSVQTTQPDPAADKTTPVAKPETTESAASPAVIPEAAKTATPGGETKKDTK